jgi:hypothetical protein
MSPVIIKQDACMFNNPVRCGLLAGLLEFYTQQVAYLMYIIKEYGSVRKPLCNVS